MSVSSCIRNVVRSLGIDYPVHLDINIASMPSHDRLEEARECLGELFELCPVPAVGRVGAGLRRATDCFYDAVLQVDREDRNKALGQAKVALCSVSEALGGAGTNPQLLEAVAAGRLSKETLNELQNALRLVRSAIVSAGYEQGELAMCSFRKALGHIVWAHFRQAVMSPVEE